MPFGRLDGRSRRTRDCRSTSSPATTTSARGDRSNRTSRSPPSDLGLRPVVGVEAIDLPGLRLVLVDSTRPGVNHGSVAHRLSDTLDAVRDAPGGVLIVMHHQLQPHHADRRLAVGRAEARVDAVPRRRRRLSHPDTLVTSGHTHRHRRWERGPITVTQVGSTEDYPGVWGGYVVHEGGIRQIVRRVTRPDCMAWTERTGRPCLGLWAVIAPGLLSSRCFNLTWGR